MRSELCTGQVLCGRHLVLGGIALLKQQRASPKPEAGRTLLSKILLCAAVLRFILIGINGPFALHLRPSHSFPLSSFSPSIHSYLSVCLKPCSFSLLPGDHLDPRCGQTLPRDSPETEAMHSSSITFHPPPVSPASFTHILVSLHSCSVSILYLSPPPFSPHFLAFWCSFITEGT